jgi:hypothetical protein
MSRPSPSYQTLISLPSEIRSLVYEEVFASLKISVKITSDGPITKIERLLPATGVGLLRCCHQIFEEA